MRISQKLSFLAVWACVVVGVLVFAVGAWAAPSPEPASMPFEIVPGSFQMTPSLFQAGAHENLTTSFDFAHSAAGKTYGDVRTAVVNLPAGFTANDTAVPACPASDLLGQQVREGAKCPPETQVGTISLDLTLESKPVYDTFPVYNVEVTSKGVTAELGFNAIILTQILRVEVRPGDAGLTVTTPVPDAGEPHDVSVTIWGVPASHEHDAERGEQCYPQPFSEPVATCGGGGKTVGIPAKPYLSTPTNCQPSTASMEADSWEEPEQWSKATTVIPAMGECERVPFGPSIAVQPTTNAAESPSGLNISLLVPQSWEKPESIATASLKNTVLALPVGYTANPSLASGLGTCTPEELEAETAEGAPGSGCPQEAKIGTVEVEAPVLAEKLGGEVYIATPFDNEFGSLLALYIVVKDPERGIIVKLRGHIEPNLVTGQLVTTFDESPQVPFSRFTLRLRQGATSPLVSPPACGTYTAEADLTPWSEPLSFAHLENSFQIEDGIGGGPCPAGGIPPFKPALIAGTLNNSAGAYSQMDIHITRNDGEQEITRFSSILPPGLTANLTGIPFCPDADIEAAKELSGAQEEAQPSCPAASEIGHSLVGAGVGPVLAYTPGRIYLAGPYNGAPFSVVAITSAKVGPFDLGTVVIRFALEINPETGVVTVDAKASDAIPHIIKGIVIHVRDIHVYVNRPDFMINPTNCDPLTFAATVGGGGQDPTNPADQQFVTTNTPFQLANCQNLQFKPAFKASTLSKTSRVNGASLTVKLAYPSAPQGTQADIKRVKVDLPEQLPSRLTTLQKACTEAQFDANPVGCPAASVIGHAKAITPILPVPLEGPAYFVSHGNAKFPELIMVLKGYGVTIDLHGETFINAQGITSSTFAAVPDEPVTSFELELHNGPYSALTANGDLCNTRLTLPTEFVAQSGAEIHQDTPLEVQGCPTALAVNSHAVHNRTLTLTVYAPAAGTLTADGKGLSSATKTSQGHETIKLKLIQKTAGKLETTVKIGFRPSSGSRHQRQARSLRLRFTR